MNILLPAYFLGAISAFSYWFIIFWNDSETSKNDSLSWKVLLTASIFWPIYVMISIINRKKQAETYYKKEPNCLNLKPLLLGEILKQAGLISDTQINIALSLQQNAEHKAKIGEIIANNGWLAQETVDFFAEYLPKLGPVLPRQPIGYYLKKARLLNDEQINLILAEQRHNKLRFGEIAIDQGWIKPETVELIMNYLPVKNQALVTD